MLGFIAEAESRHSGLRRQRSRGCCARLQKPVRLPAYGQMRPFVIGSFRRTGARIGLGQQPCVTMSGAWLPRKSDFLPLLRFRWLNEQRRQLCERQFDRGEMTGKVACRFNFPFAHHVVRQF